MNLGWISVPDALTKYFDFSRCLLMLAIGIAEGGHC
jgi:hypothetical protein